MTHMRIEITTRGNVFAETTQHLQQQMLTRGIFKIFNLELAIDLDKFNKRDEF